MQSKNNIENPLDIRVFGTENDTIVDGPGLRFGVFVQGCSHKCSGCHNPGSWDEGGGVLTNAQAILQEIHDNPLVKSVTLSGGEPFEQAGACAQLASELKREGYNIWCYTGYLLEDLLDMAGSSQDGQNAQDNQGGAKIESGVGHENETANERDKGDKLDKHDKYSALKLLRSIDVLVDGPFVESLQSYKLKWRGSSNQRLIDMPKTFATGKLVLWKPVEYKIEKPDNW